MELLNGPASIVTGGTRFLGQPLGDRIFANTFLSKAATSFQAASIRLQQRCADPQIASTLFRFCTTASVPHLLAADVFTNLHRFPQLSSLKWSSPFTSSISSTTFTFLAHSAGQSSLTLLAQAIATRPIRTGGIGFRDASLSALPACIIPLLRSIRYASQGIPHRADPTLYHHLPTIYTQHLTHWRTTTSPNVLIKTLRLVLPSFHTATLSLLSNPSPSWSSTDTVLSRPLSGLSSRLYQQAIGAGWAALLPSLCERTLGILPSLLSPTTSIPLHSLPRSYPDHRFSADDYRILLRRKLRLPIQPHVVQPTLCPHCPQLMDIFGDHYFSCVFSKRNTPTFHNHIRDTLLHIGRTLAPLAGVVRSPHDVLCEPSNCLPSFPTRRPFDLAFRLIKPSADGISIVGIDVTRPPVFKPLNRQSTSHLPEITRTHLFSMRAKLEGRCHSNIPGHSIIQAINDNHAALLPFTVDHFGGLGPLSIPLLFHPKRSPILPAPPLQPEMLNFTNEHSQIALSRSIHNTNLHLADRATTTWKTVHPQLPFGSTHHTFTPTQWAMQALSLNISHALATAISTALIELPTPHNSAPTSFRGPTPNTFLRRQSAYRIAAQPPDFSHLASIITW